MFRLKKEEKQVTECKCGYGRMNLTEQVSKTQFSMCMEFAHQVAVSEPMIIFSIVFIVTSAGLF